MAGKNIRRTAPARNRGGPTAQAKRALPAVDVAVQNIQDFLRGDVFALLEPVLRDNLALRYGIRETVEDKPTHVDPCHTDAGAWCWSSYAYDSCETTEKTCVRKIPYHGGKPLPPPK